MNHLIFCFVLFWNSYPRKIVLSKSTASKERQSRILLKLAELMKFTHYISWIRIMYKTNDSDINSTRNKNQSFLKDNKISVAKRNTDQARLDVHTAQYEAHCIWYECESFKKKKLFNLGQLYPTVQVINFITYDKTCFVSTVLILPIYFSIFWFLIFFYCRYFTRFH